MDQPAEVDATPDRFRTLAWEGYFTEVFDRDLPELGHPVGGPAALRNWLRAYAAAAATISSYTDILDNACPNETGKPTKATTLAWREMLARMWLLDPLPAWEDPFHQAGRLVVACEFGVFAPLAALIGAMIASEAQSESAHRCVTKRNTS